MSEALIIDDHPITHLGCRRLLQEAGFATVFEASNAEDGLRAFRRSRPQLVVLDLGLPGASGLSLISSILTQDPQAIILVFSMHDDAVLAAKALETGALGYLTKSARPEDFLTAVNTVMKRRVYLSYSMATEVAILNTRQSVNPLNQLTRRELEVLKLIGAGKAYHEIAEELHLSYKTVVNTCTQLKNKLGIKTLAELIRFAIEHTPAGL